MRSSSLSALLADLWKASPMRPLLFCGDNRKAELERLKAAYLDIAATAVEARDQTNPTAPFMLLCEIHAERGLGKTRLAMGVYRWLST